MHCNQRKLSHGNKDPAQSKINIFFEKGKTKTKARDLYLQKNRCTDLFSHIEIQIKHSNISLSPNLFHLFYFMTFLEFTTHILTNTLYLSPCVLPTIMSPAPETAHPRKSASLRMSGFYTKASPNISRYTAMVRSRHSLVNWMAQVQLLPKVAV